MAGTVAEAIKEGARRHPATTIAVESVVRPSSASLSQIFEQSSCVAAGLTGLGVRPGDVVAMQLPSWHECIVTHAAVWLCGAVLLPIVPIYGPGETELILKRSGARVFISTGTLGKRDTTATIAAARKLPTLEHVITVGDPVPHTIAFDELIRSSPTELAGLRDDVAPDVRCLLVYTSGTTAEPKGVQHTHASLLGEIDSMEQMSGDSAAPTLIVFPPGHIAGALGVLSSLTRASSTFVLDAWNAETAAQLIARHKIGASGGAPIHLGAILDAAERLGLDVSSLTDYTTGAANVAADLIRRADRLGIRAWRCYGSSEHPTISSGTRDDPLDKRAETDGRLTPGTEIRLVDDDGVDVAGGSDGEILTRGPDLFAGYTDADRARESMIDGWFRTGDVGRLDAHGYLTITDRKKDIIIRGGENISSKEVEDTLGTHPAIAEVAVIGAPDQRYGERVCAVVVLKPGMQFGLDDASAHIQQHGLARQKTPERIMVVDELPRTAIGKVRKHLLRQRLG